MAKAIIKKLKDAVISVLPVTVLVLIIGLSTSSIKGYDLGAFCIGAAMLILGMALYSLGTEIAIEPVGDQLGAKISRIKKPWLILIICFVIGVVVTIAEPDLGVLASQVDSINKWVLIVTVAVGVGVFMLLAVLRIFLKIDIKWVFLAAFAVVFILVCFVAQGFVPLSFDSGGVTTGPITVPFILAFGTGVSTVVAAKSDDNSFGLVGICSVGPIIAVLLLGIFYGSDSATANVVATSFDSLSSLSLGYLNTFIGYLKDVAIAISPIIGLFIIAQITIIRLPKKALVKIGVGFIYTYFGLTVFLTGVSAGFMPAGVTIGEALTNINPYITIPIGVILGAVIVLAEPAVHILNKQVENVTGGLIKRSTMLKIFSLSMAVALGLAMLRLVLKFNILYILVPGYAVALAMMFFVPKIFTGIAFDSGGVASGPMTATFILPMAIGASVNIGGNPMTDAFGVVAVVAMTPLLTIQFAGLAYKLKLKRTIQISNEAFNALLVREGEIIDLEA